MSSDDIGDIVQELSGLIHDELKVISYKWLARQYSISANLAKRLLFKFAEEQRDKVRTVYLVSGWTKAEPPSHTYQLVEANQVQVCRESLSEVTGMHVYSVAPNQPTNPDSLWQLAYQQSQQLQKEILAGQPSASAQTFRNNACSAVRFVGAPPQAVSRPAAAPAAVVVAPKQAAPARAVAPAAAPSKPAVEVRSPALGGEETAKAVSAGTAAGLPLQPPAAAGLQDADISPPKPTGPSPPKAPVAGAKATGKASAAAAKSKTLSNMWNKAKPKPAAEAHAAAPPAATAAAAAPEAAVAVAVTSNGGGDRMTDEDDEDGMRLAAGSSRGRKRRGAQIEDSDDEGAAVAAAAAQPGDDSAAEATEPSGGTAGAAANTQPAAAKGKGAGGKATKEAKGPAKGAGTKRAKTAPASKREPEDADQQAAAWGGHHVDDAVVEALGTVAAAPAPVAAAASKPAAAGHGSRGRKTTRTYINDMGEEVTEEVYEERPAPLQPQQQPVAAPTAQGSPVAVKGGGGAGAKPAGKAAPAAKGKGKAPAAGQKSMTSFFQKK